MQQFCEARQTVRDEHHALVPFCRTLEDVVQDGLRGYGSRLSSQVRDGPKNSLSRHKVGVADGSKEL